MVRHGEHFGDDRMSAKNLWPNFKELIERESLRDRRRDRENKFLKKIIYSSPTLKFRVTQWHPPVINHSNQGHFHIIQIPHEN